MLHTHSTYGVLWHEWRTQLVGKLLILERNDCLDTLNSDGKKKFKDEDDVDDI